MRGTRRLLEPQRVLGSPLNRGFPGTPEPLGSRAGPRKAHQGAPQEAGGEWTGSRQATAAIVLALCGHCAFLTAPEGTVA
ncbi:hypothetical protein NDU88_004444 [Pleurodeles waltl]|uniref:Uncharacterized protein n=1 Tax=Pleurodeles waltl TaxID=8319 RepID=A0AAV7M738_PLEWA|nr:hypothetical protein NDU88_004444 [Pleurodeles waltl]